MVFQLFVSPCLFIPFSSLVLLYSFVSLFIHFFVFSWFYVLLFFPYFLLLYLLDFWVVMAITLTYCYKLWLRVRVCVRHIYNNLLDSMFVLWSFQICSMLWRVCKISWIYTNKPYQTMRVYWNVTSRNFIRKWIHILNKTKHADFLDFAVHLYKFTSPQNHFAVYILLQEFK
jgi:hypothetical protein